MLPAVAAALIGGGASLLQNIGNGLFQSSANRQAQNFAENMYARQRTDALADWNMQNDYNSPAAQMQRLKAAGLNPNLVYGNGTAVTTAQSAPRSSSPQSYTPTAPKLDLTGIGSSIIDGLHAAQIKAQTDNTTAATDVAKQQMALIAAQTAATVANTFRTGVGTEQDAFNLQQAKANALVSLEQSKANLAKTQADTTVTLAANERAKAMQESTLALQAQQIAKMRVEQANIKQSTAESKQRVLAIQQNIENAAKDGTLKQLEINLKNLGINQGDPAYMRILAQLGDGISAKDLLNKIQQSDYLPKASKLKPSAQNFYNHFME